MKKLSAERRLEVTGSADNSKCTAAKYYIVDEEDWLLLSLIVIRFLAETAVDLDISRVRVCVCYQ